MSEEIENTLKSHYGVTECVIDHLSDQDTIEVYCVGGNVDYIKIALAQLCNVDDDCVTVVTNNGGRVLFVVKL
jgi:hypothetical protein